MLAVIVFGQSGFAFASLKSGSGRLRCKTLRQLGSCFTLRFKSTRTAYKTQKGQPHG